MVVDDSYFAKVAEANNMEPDEVKKIYYGALEKIKQLPKAKGRSEIALERWAKSQLVLILSNRHRAGKEFVFIIVGTLGRPRDWNEAVFKYNESAIVTSLRQLIAEGAVMTIEKDGKKFPIKEIKSYHMVKRVVDKARGVIVDISPDTVDEDDENYVVIDEMVVDDGEIWDPIKDGSTYPIWRDKVLINENLGSVNWGYSKPLGHNYRMSLAALGFPKDDEDDLRLIEIIIGGDGANPESDEFFLKKFDMFKPYSAEFIELEDREDDHKYVLRYVGSAPKPYDFDEPVEVIVEKMIDALKQTFPDKDDIPEFYDGASGFIEFHEAFVQRDESGAIRRSRSGYEYVPWYKICIVIGYVDAIYEPKREGGKPMFRLRDATMSSSESITAYCDDAMFRFPDIAKIPGTFIISGKTMRSPYKYDRKLRKRITAPPGEGDITVNVVAMKSIDTLVDLDEEGEL